MKTGTRALVVTVLLLPGVAAWGESGPDEKRFDIGLETGAVWFSRNDTRIPGDTGTRFDMMDLTGSGPDIFARVDGSWDINDKHGLRVVLAPLDAALAPISTFVGIRRNLRDIDDPLPVKIIYPVPGYFYAVGLQFMCSWIRLTTGFLEMGAGVLVLPFETDIEPLFDPADDADALVEIDIDYMDYPLRFGVNYTNSAF